MWKINLKKKFSLRHLIHLCLPQVMSYYVRYAWHHCLEVLLQILHSVFLCDIKVINISSKSVCLSNPQILLYALCKSHPRCHVCQCCVLNKHAQNTASYPILSFFFLILVCSISTQIANKDLTYFLSEELIMFFIITL